MTAQELGNDHGYRCPECKSGEQIQVAATHWTQLVPNGTDDSLVDDGSEEWGENDGARCGDCDWSGLVKELLVVELEDFL